MFRNERGSALLVSLVLIVIIAILGAALFHLGVVESRAVLASEVDYKAFEIAQTGIDRMLHRLYLEACSGSVTCTGLPTGWQPDWAKGTINGQSFPVASSYTEFTLGGNQLSSGFLGEVSGTGTYTVELRHLTLTEIAAHFGVTCEESLVSASICADAVVVRSTGNYTVGTVTTARTLEVLARVRPTSPTGGSGLTAGAPSGASIEGNVRIAGSVHIIGCGVPPCAGMDDLDLGGTAGIQNSYRGMPADVQARIPRLPMVCLASNAACNPSNVNTTEGVESLGAEVRVAAPILSPAISLSGAATVGDNGGSNGYLTYTYGGQTVRAKANVDGIYVADGCQTSTCSDNYGGTAGAGNVYADNGVTNPYDINPAPALPTLRNFPVEIGGNTYANYACAGLACSGSDFFGLHTVAITDPPNGFTRQSGGVPEGLRWNSGSNRTEDFNLTVTWKDPLNHPGSTTPTTDVQGCMAFRRENLAADEAILSFHQGACPTLPPLVGTAPRPLPSALPTNNLQPMLVYVDGTFGIQDRLIYQGAAIIVASGQVVIDNRLTTPDCAGCPPAAIFPRAHLFAISTPADMAVGNGTTGSDPAIYGYFYSGGLWTTSKQIHFVGSATADRFSFTQVPRFWQVPSADPNSLIFPSLTKKWVVSSSHWRRCRPNPSASDIKCQT